MDITIDSALMRIIIDQLKQYREYSEAMRAHGRGLYLSSPISAEGLILDLERTIARAAHDEVSR